MATEPQSGDIMPGDWVRMVSGGPIGYVKSVADAEARVIWLGAEHAPTEAIHVSILVVVA